MKTHIFMPDQLDQAAQCLKEGGLVAFPTETVFGLGAIANNEAAVQSVFKTKGRPNDNPLIIHVASIESVHHYAASVSPLAQALMEKFWPGPLTIILPIKTGTFAPAATAGQNTAGFRMPDQDQTLSLIDKVGFPLVGPSANLSGKPSPTSLAHVLHDFNGKIAGVVANQAELTAIGVESTVVLPLADHIEILRPGHVTVDMIEEAIGVPAHVRTAAEQLANQAIMSPGVKYRHYSPKQPVYLMAFDHTLEDWQEEIDKFPEAVAILAYQDHITSLQNHQKVVASYSLGKKDDWESATRHLFAGLRALEESSAKILMVQGLDPKVADHQAYMNRLSKAATHVL